MLFHLRFGCCFYHLHLHWSGWSVKRLLYANQGREMICSVGLAFSVLLIWGSNVINLGCHTAYCGVFSRWYFSQEGLLLVDSLRVAAITSFGSVCFGAFIGIPMTFVHCAPLDEGGRMVSTRRKLDQPCGWLHPEHDHYMHWRFGGGAPYVAQAIVHPPKLPMLWSFVMDLVWESLLICYWILLQVWHVVRHGWMWFGCHQLHLFPSKLDLGFDWLICGILGSSFCLDWWWHHTQDFR